LFLYPLNTNQGLNGKLQVYEEVGNFGDGIKENSVCKK
jgi:hypothetical protein